MFQSRPFLAAYSRKKIPASIMLTGESMNKEY
jgi:hypothetical protein